MLTDTITSERVTPAQVFDRLGDMTQKVYSFIVDYKKVRDGNSPTVSEIIEGLRLSSRSQVVWHLDKLEKAGLVRRIGGASRGIVIIGGSWSLDAPHKGLHVPYQEEA